MSSYGDIKQFTFENMTSGLTLSTYVDLAQGWGGYALVIPTMTSGTDVYIKGSDSVTGTYRRIYWRGTTATPVANFGSAITNGVVNLNGNLPQFVKIELSTAMTATQAQFKILCWN